MAAAGSAYVLHSLVKCSIYPSVIVPDGLHIYRRPRTRRITLLGRRSARGAGMLSVMHPALRATVGRTHVLRAAISPREILHQSRVASSRRSNEVQFPHV